LQENLLVNYEGGKSKEWTDESSPHKWTTALSVRTAESRERVASLGEFTPSSRRGTSGRGALGTIHTS